MKQVTQVGRTDGQQCRSVRQAKLHSFRQLRLCGRRLVHGAFLVRSDRDSSCEPRRQSAFTRPTRSSACIIVTRSCRAESSSHVAVTNTRITWHSDTSARSSPTSGCGSAVGAVSRSVDGVPGITSVPFDGSAMPVGVGRLPTASALETGEVAALSKGDAMVVRGAVLSLLCLSICTLSFEGHERKRAAARQTSQRPAPRKRTRSHRPGSTCQLQAEPPTSSYHAGDW